MVQLDGAPAAPSVQYQGPVFPPRPRLAASEQDRSPVMAVRPELVEQLVDW